MPLWVKNEKEFWKIIDWGDEFGEWGDFCSFTCGVLGGVVGAAVAGGSGLAATVGGILIGATVGEGCTYFVCNWFCKNDR